LGLRADQNWPGAVQSREARVGLPHVIDGMASHTAPTSEPPSAHPNWLPSEQNVSSTASVLERLGFGVFQTAGPKTYCTAQTVFLSMSYAQTPAGSANKQFFDAIKGGDAAKVQQLLKRDSSLAKASNEKGATAVLYAVYSKHKDIAELLINETLAVAPMCICNPDCSTARIYRRNAAPTPTGFAEMNPSGISSRWWLAMRSPARCLQPGSQLNFALWATVVGDVHTLRERRLMA